MIFTNKRRRSKVGFTIGVASVGIYGMRGLRLLPLFEKIILTTRLKIDPT